MKNQVLILSILLLCFVLAPAVGAQGMGMFGWEPPWVDEIPEMEPPSWEDGQYVTYNFNLAAEGETITADLRCALVGEETIEGEDYHWLEVDVFNVGDLPEDMMIGEDFESFKVKILMKEYNLTFTEQNPEEFMEDIFSMEFIKRVIFQMNDETPYELDMSFLQMFAPMMEMAMEEAEGMEPPEEFEDMMENVDWGMDTQTVTTPAGTFADTLYLWFTTGDEAGNMNMNIYAHEDVPLTVLVKLAGEVEDTYQGGAFDMNIELIDYGDGAESWITGEPELFSFDMMGDMMGMGMMGEM
jgi:hypothetical protein